MSGYFIKSKYKLISSLIRRKFQRFRNFSFENISLCLGKHIGGSLAEFATLYSFKLALNLYIMAFKCLGKQNLFEITNEQNYHLSHVQPMSGRCVRIQY